MSFSGESKGFINYVYERYSNLRVRDISLVFEGQITHQVMKALTGLVEEISVFLEKLNILDTDSLDDLYIKQMWEGTVSPKGGAGPGFIDIRRKTGNPLDFSFVKIDEETTFFIFTSTITR